MGKGVPPARRWSPLGSLLAVAVGFVLAALVWVNVVGLVRERASQAQVDLYRHQTARLYSIETGPQSRSRWTARRSLVESENWDEERGRCGDEAETCSLTFRLPPQPVWDSSRFVNRTAGILDITSPQTGEVDAGFVCVLADVVLREDHWITSAEPLIDTFDDPTKPGASFDLVHHMDFFFCEAGTSTTRRYSLDDPYVCSHDAFVQNSLPLNVKGRVRKFLEMTIPELHPSCIFGAVYDRGGAALSLPQDLGILVGPSTARAREIVLQAHYLAPLGFSEAYSPVWDSSGYKITLRRVRPRDSAAGQGKHAVGLLALNDYGLNYPKGRSRHTHSYLIEEAALRDSLKGDFADFGGEVQPVAVHLHGHSLTKRIWIDHLRGGAKVGEFGRIQSYDAHSEDQSFFFLPPQDASRPLRSGDSLRVNCEVDTSSAGRDVFYGVSHFTEMCSAVVAYKNHNPANPSNYVRTANILSTCTDISRCFSAGKGKEEQGGARGG